MHFGDNKTRLNPWPLIFWGFKIIFQPNWIPRNGLKKELVILDFGRFKHLGVFDGKILC